MATRQMIWKLSALSLSFGVLSCTDSSTVEPRTFTATVYADARPGGHAGTPMSGDEEVPPVDTRARGVVNFTLSEDGTRLDYRLIVANLENVTQAHIHIAPKGVNGPVVVFLFGFVAGGVTENGVLAEGTITAANLIPRPAIGFGATMAELVAAIRNGNAYANAHTVAFPGGEIRGQIETHGHTF